MNDRRTTIALLMFILGMTLLLTSRQQKLRQGQRSQSSINSKLKATDMSIQLNHALTEKVLQQMRDEAAVSRSYNANTAYGMKLKQESHAVSIAEENRRQEQPSTFRVRDVDERILRQIADQQFLDGYDEAYKQAFVEAFIQNARENGLDVSLNDNLEVIQVVPVSTNEPIRFPNSESGPTGAGK